MTTGARMSLPTQDAALSALYDRLGPVPYQVYDELPDDLPGQQAALLLLDDQPTGGLGVFRLSEDEVVAEAAAEKALRDAATSLCPGLVRGFEIVALRDGARAIVWLAPMPSLERWTDQLLDPAPTGRWSRTRLLLSSAVLRRILRMPGPTRTEGTRRGGSGERVRSLCFT